MALEKAKQRLANTTNYKNIVKTEEWWELDKLYRKDIQANIVFNITQPVKEPLLNIADYFCWAIQRVFEKGEVRYYNYLQEKISVVIDLYDKEKYGGWTNYYGPKNPLTSENKISLPLH